jgi:hypothetical protein
MEIYKEWLRENGYKFSVEPVGIVFRHQGKTFFLEDNEGDELFLRILMPNIYSTDDPAEREHAHTICNDITREVKCLKAFFVDESRVWLATEILIDHTPELDDFMERLLEILHEGQYRFQAKL